MTAESAGQQAVAEPTNTTTLPPPNLPPPPPIQTQLNHLLDPPAAEEHPGPPARPPVPLNFPSAPPPRPPPPPPPPPRPRTPLIDDQRVQDLPMNGRNVVALAGTYAGVTSIRANQDTSDGRQGPIMSVNGGNTNHNLFTLNGSVFTHFNQTTGFNPPPPDAIQEDPDSNAQLLRRVRPHRRQPGEHRLQGGLEHVPRNRLGVPSQLGAERAQLLPDAESPSRSRTRRARAPAARSSATSCSGSARTSGSGIAPRPGSSQTVVPTDAQRAGDFTRSARSCEESGQSDHERAVHRQLGRALRRGQHHQAGLHQPGRHGPAGHHVPASATGTVVTLSPAPRDHAVYMGRGDYHFSGNNQLNAHFFADRSDSSSWPGNVNYVQQSVFSDVNQFGVSDAHIFSPRLVNEVTFSYLTSRSGGGAVTQIAPRDQGVNVDVGNDGRGMSYSVSGSINLAYPGVNAQDYTSWQFKDTMTFNVGNHTLKWGYEFIRPVFEFNLALTRSANFQGTRTGNADRGLHDRRVRQLDDRVRDCRPQSVAR